MFFVLALNYKQMCLYYALPFFVYVKPATTYTPDACSPVVVLAGPRPQYARRTRAKSAPLTAIHTSRPGL